MSLPDDLLFLDTETTGLSLDHDVWEVAYALGDGPIHSHLLPHSLRNADPKALEVNGYRRRFPDGVGGQSSFADLRLREVFTGKTIVGANPAFDAYRLQRRWGEAPWHYRLVDVESMAVVVFDLDHPVGLRAIAEKLAEEGWEIPQPDHTAAGDVATVRAVYKALRSRRDGVARHVGEEHW
jgi:hypothetical protein